MHAPIASAEERTQHPAHNTDQDRAPKSAPETVDMKSVHKLVHKQEHEAVHDKDENAEKEMQKRKRDAERERTSKAAREEAERIELKKKKDDDDENTPLTGIIRSNQRFLPKSMTNLLSEAVSIAYNVDTDAYELDVDEVKWSQFYYLLCEFKVRKDLAYIGYTEYDTKMKNQYILDVDQLFMKVIELEEKTELCRKNGLDAIRKSEENKKMAFLATLEMEKKAAQELVAKSIEEKKNERSRKLLVPIPKKSVQPASTPMTTKPKIIGQKIIEKTVEEKERDEIKRNEWLEMFDAIDGPIITSIQQQPIVGSSSSKPLGITPIIDKKIVNLSKRKNIPPHYGIPEIDKMKARIYRIRWILNYHQNGWLSTEYSMNFDSPHPENHHKSLHGWSSREIPQTTEAIRRGDFNNAYYTFRYHGGPVVPGVIPFSIFETSETDNVYDRSYKEYFSG